MGGKHVKVYRDLNYFKHFLTFGSAASRCFNFFASWCFYRY